MQLRQVPVILATLTASFILPMHAQAGGQTLPEYQVTELGDEIETVFPGVTFPSSDARGLNENGDLIGEAQLNWDPVEGAKMQAFIYTVEHGVVALPLIPGFYSNAVRDISDRDENGEVIIVGGGVPGLYVDIVIGVAAMWRYSTVTGEVIETRTIGVPTGYEDSLAVAVSNDGTVAGFSGLTGPFTNWKYDIASDTLETFSFPVRMADMNNVGQVCGGNYRGDLFGNFEDLSETYEPGDVMPWWAIDNGGISANWHRINDSGSLVGRAPTGLSDGAGHLRVAIVRRVDEGHWISFDAVSHLTLAGGINNLGDFMTRTGGVIFADQPGTLSFNTLLAPEWQGTVNVAHTEEINDSRQVAGAQAHAILLTPIGPEMTPGDIDGDGVINEQDRALMCIAMGSSVTGREYDPAADLNDDGAIDHLDLAMFNDFLPPCNGDVVNSATFQPPADGVTDGADLAYLLGAWSNQPSCADFVSSDTFAPPPDGSVDGADLAHLLGSWGVCE